MADTLGVGIIGCGNISSAYMSLGPLFKGIHVKACADINLDAAKERAEEFGRRTMRFVQKFLMLESTCIRKSPLC